MYIRQAHLFMVTLTIKFKHMYTCNFVKALIHSGVNMITQECLDMIMKFEYNIVNENITDEVDSGHCSVKVKVTTGLFSPSTTIQTVRYYNQCLNMLALFFTYAPTHTINNGKTICDLVLQGLRS